MFYSNCIYIYVYIYTYIYLQAAASAADLLGSDLPHPALAAGGMSSPGAAGRLELGQPEVPCGTESWPL